MSNPELIRLFYCTYFYLCYCLTYIKFIFVINNFCIYIFICFYYLDKYKGCDMSGRSESRSETPRSENQNDEIEKQEVGRLKTIKLYKLFILGHRTSSKYGGNSTASK